MVYMYTYCVYLWYNNIIMIIIAPYFGIGIGRQIKCVVDVLFLEKFKNEQ